MSFNYYDLAAEKEHFALTKLGEFIENGINNYIEFQNESPHSVALAFYRRSA